MAQLIKNKHNKAIINLDNVTSITPTTLNQEFKIHFSFAALNNSELYVEVWGFKNKDDFEITLGKINVLIEII